MMDNEDDLRTAQKHMARVNLRITPEVSTGERVSESVFAPSQRRSTGYASIVGENSWPRQSNAIPSNIRRSSNYLFSAFL